MTRREFCAALETLGYPSNAAAARALGVHESAVSKWRSGANPVPSWIGEKVAFQLRVGLLVDSPARPTALEFEAMAGDAQMLRVVAYVRALEELTGITRGGNTKRPAA